MKSKRRQIFYVFLSLLIASMVWFYVSNNDEITVNVHGCLLYTSDAADDQAPV